MKMMMIVFNEAVDEEVMEVLAGCRLTNYTRLDGVFGRGTGSGTHLGTDIWPGRNNLLLLAVSDEDASRLMTCVGELRRRLKREGVKGFVWNLEAVT